MRLQSISLQIAGLMLFVSACGDDAEPNTTPSPTAAPTSTASQPTPTVGAQTPEATPPAAESFRTFAGEIDAAALRGDSAWFQQRIVTTPVVCDESNTPPQLGGPACDAIGQTFDGFSVGYWRSEGGLVPGDQVTAIFDRLFGGTLIEDRDEFGDGVASVYAISDEGSEATAVITALVQRPDDFAGTGPLRVSLSTDWTIDAGAWRMDFILIAYVLAEEFLVPVDEIDSYLPNWERF